MTFLEAVFIYYMVGAPLVLGLLWSGTMKRAGGEKIPAWAILLMVLSWPSVIVVMVMQMFRDD